MNNEMWAFLLDEWSGAGTGQPGEGVGSFTLAYDLDQKIIVRKNHVDYPAQADRSAFVHDDLTIIYSSSNEVDKAIYFDNEGHVIHYEVTYPDPNSIVFLSNLIPNQPRFRLTYLINDRDQLTIRFEIAALDRAEAFNVYTEGIVKRK